MKTRSFCLMAVPSVHLVICVLISCRITIGGGIRSSYRAARLSMCSPTQSSTSSQRYVCSCLRGTRKLSVTSRVHTDPQMFFVEQGSLSSVTSRVHTDPQMFFVEQGSSALRPGFTRIPKYSSWNKVAQRYVQGSHGSPNILRGTR